MSTPSETILQFGAGRFLRAFFDLFVHQANQQGQNIGQIAVIQSTGDDRASLLNSSGGKYHVIIRGIEEGKTIDRVEECGSISRALVADRQWDEVLALARSPSLRTIVSNTTEAGYNLDPSDGPTSAHPKSFPGKLYVLMRERFAAQLPAPTIIACELLEGNAVLLRDKVLGLADAWGGSDELKHWLRQDCVWLQTLVDRIVSGTPKDHPLLATDPLVIVAEPFAFFALEEHPRSAFTCIHPAIVRTPDVLPYFLRKVRILNAGHTALLIQAQPKGYALVREAMADPELANWLERLFAEEIVPTLEGRVAEPQRFALQTLDRFRNPFLDHKFSDIALHHSTKVQIRLVSTWKEYQERFGKEPPLLTAVLQSAGVL